MITHHYSKINTAFKLNNQSFNKNTLKEKANWFTREGEAFEKEIGEFLLDWLNDNKTIVVSTSGSTGKPKQIVLNKIAMVNSAIATGAFFDLQATNKVLLCLPASYIAGKMMMVRALVLGLEIDCVKPSSVITIDKSNKYDFVAMVPMQVQNSIESLTAIKTLIIGGAPVSLVLISSLKEIKTKVYETYGMTETITHIAVKKLNQFKTKDKNTTFFKVLPDVLITKDNRNCLVIEAPKLTNDKIITNDVVKLISVTSFEWLGRYDNIINSGGVKINPEQIEQKLKPHIKERFFIASKQDDRLGEKVILIIETNNKSIIEPLYSKLKELSNLTSYEKPKRIIPVPKFLETASGKIKRKETSVLALI